MVKQTLLAWFALVLSATALADNVSKASYTFTDGDTITVSLSSVNINRLVVKNDRIINITCPPGFCTATGNQNDKTGSVSVKLNVGLPFTAHLTTEKGRLFALFITPKATPSIVTEFVPQFHQHSEPTVFDLEFDYPAAIAAFTEAMMIHYRDGTPVSGFSIHPVDPKTLPKDTSPLAVVPQTVLVGKDYSGIIYEVRNQSNKAVTLTTAQFYSYAARSAALDDYDLKPGEHTVLYLITGGGASHVR